MGMPAENSIKRQREAVLYAQLYAQGDRTGGDWWHSSCHGTTLRGTILTVAVAAIMITAPLGAFAIDRTYQKFLIKNDMGRLL